MPFKTEAGGFDVLKSFAEASTTEEPGAGKLHAGICAGVVG
jgi:hypothetical protein